MSKRKIKAEDLLNSVYLGNPEIDPTEKNVLFTHKTITKKKKYLTHLYSVSIESQAIKQWTRGDESCAAAHWSPDGKVISFVTGREKPASQIYFLPVEGGEARKVTDLPEGSIGEYLWSPDGKYIAFTFRETDEPFTEKAKKKREEEGGATPPIIIDTMWYRLDGDGCFGNQRYKLYLLDVQTGTHKQIYSGCALGFYDFSWAHNSKELLVMHPYGERPLAEKPNNQLYKVSLEGKAKQVPHLPLGDKGTPRYSPDMTKIAFTGNLDETDAWGAKNSRVYLIDANGSEPKCLTLGDEVDITSSCLSDTKEGSPFLFTWAPDGSGLYTVKSFHGEEQIVFISVEGQLEEITAGQHVLLAGNLSKSTTQVPVIRCHAGGLGEVGLVELKSKSPLKMLTHLNDELFKELEVAMPEEHWVETKDGTKVHTWVIKPTDLKPGTRVPAVLEVHGGPHLQYGWAFFHEFQVLASEGYVVVYCNPRGSKGYGEQHCNAIFRKWGDKDWTDVQAVIEFMSHLPEVDRDKKGIMGGSYGGYMTNWAIGHCQDFKAAITDRCVSNFISMSGSSDFPLNPDSYFGGCPYGGYDQIEELWRQSPISYFDQVKTPTLVIHSEGDMRCNIEQSEQVYYALQMQNIPSRFVRYPAETSHGLSRTGPPDLRLHRLGEITSWWKRWLQ